MKKKNIIITISSIIVIFGTIVFITINPKDTTLDFYVRNAVSKGWVWDSTITLQERTIRGYYQSDRGPITYRFTHLKPGEYQMRLSAPSYETKIVPVIIKKGNNSIAEPIDLMAYEIPNLEKFVIFEEYEGSDIVQEIRPVGTDGAAILNHPCMNIQIAAIVSVQTRNGMPVQEKSDSGSDRGEALFYGRIDWIWDSLPETYFRYSSRIPGSRIKKNSAPFLVIDYLVLVPDPEKITDEELAAVLEQAAGLKGLEELQGFLEKAATGRFKYYFFTSWNVPGGNV